MSPEERKERAKEAYKRWYASPKGLAYREARKKPRAVPDAPEAPFRTEPETPIELAQQTVPQPGP